RGPQRAELVGAHNGWPRPTGWRDETNDSDAIRAEVRQRMQHHGIDHRKETCTRGNAERENQHGGRRKPAIAPQHSRGKPKVVRQVGEHLAIGKHAYTTTSPALCAVSL